MLPISIILKTEKEKKEEEGITQLYNPIRFCIIGNALGNRSNIL